MSSWNRGSSAFGNSGKFFGGNHGQRGGQAYGSRAQSPAQSITIQTGAAPARRFVPRAPARQQRVPVRTDEEKANFIKSTTRELFLRSFRLCCLPGNIPLCYATGNCLVTEYAIWNDYIKKDCKPYAEKIAQWGQPQENEAPFTWGLRPIEPRFLSPIDEEATAQWVWTFIKTNITPYKEAVNVLTEGLKGKKFGTENDAEMAAALAEWVGVKEMPDNSFMVKAITHALEFVEGIAPGDLSRDYSSDQPHFANLKLLQQSEVLNETVSKLQARIASASASATGSAAGLTNPPPTSPQRQNYLSDSEDVVESQTIVSNA